MSVGRLCSRMLATIPQHASVTHAAQRMAELGIDTLVVLGEDEEPTGVVTDRDLVVRCIARGLEVHETEVRAVMTTPVPPDLVVPIQERTETRDGHAASLHVLRGSTYETLPSLLAIDDALTMVRLEMARQSGSETTDADAPTTMRTHARMSASANARANARPPS